MSQFLSRCDASAMRDAAEILIAGGLVAFPTETVYGLGADACNAAAIARIYSVKDRPVDHPLIVHIADLKYLEQWISDIPEFAIALARKFWPGPMTLILHRSELANDFITGGQNTVGVRIPDNAIALGLLEAFHESGGSGIAAPSANRFGNVSPTNAQAVAAELGDYLAEGDQILDGDACDVGVESTIIDCTTDSPRVLRPGAITIEMIEEVTGKTVATKFSDSNIRFSGSLENHYAPKARVILDQDPIVGSGFIALYGTSTPAGVIRLASPKSVEEFARVLYQSLRDGDHLDLESIYVEQPLGVGLAVAIRDRLSRSAKGR